MWDQVLNENGLDAHKQRADSIVQPQGRPMSRNYSIVWSPSQSHL